MHRAKRFCDNRRTTNTVRNTAKICTPAIVKENILKAGSLGRQNTHSPLAQSRRLRKESNSLENVDQGMEHSENNVYTEYADPKRTEWITKIQPALKKVKLVALVKACGKRLSRREIIELRAGRKKPHRKTQQLLESVLIKWLGVPL